MAVDALRLLKEDLVVNLPHIMLLLLVAAALPLPAKAQALADSRDSSGTAAISTPARSDLNYFRPTTKMKLHSYFFETFQPSGPYTARMEARGCGL
jgi:hypothetical protein